MTKPSFTDLLKKEILLSLMLTIAILVSVFFAYDYVRFQTEINQLREDYLTSQKQIIKEQIDRAISYIDFHRSKAEDRLKAELQTKVREAHQAISFIYDKSKSTKSEQEIADQIRNTLVSIRWRSGNGYYYAFDTDGYSRIHPRDEPGKYVLDLKDKMGEPFIKNSIDLAISKGEGFINYHFEKPPGSGVVGKKLSFVKLFEPLNWVIGSGNYTDDTRSEIQGLVKQRLTNVRYAKGEGYLFAIDYNGITILSGAQPENAGLNRFDLEDVNGVKFIQEIIRKGQDEQGVFVNYTWRKPSTGNPAPKLSYARCVSYWQWCIGTGLYLDDIEKTIGEKAEKLRNEYLQKSLIIAVAVMVLLLLMRIISQKRIRKASADFDLFHRFLDKAAEQSINVDSKHVQYAEFESLADMANRMIDAREIADAKIANHQKELEQLVEQRTMELSHRNDQLEHEIEVREKTEAELKFLRNLLRNIINSMPSVLIGVDPSGNVMQWNKEAERATGVNAEQAEGKPLAKVYPLLSDEVSRVQQAIDRQRPFKDGKVPMQKNGETYFTDIMVYPLIANGIQGAVIRMDDVTERVRLEDLMVQTEKMMTVGGLAAGMAHEINNPLAGIMQNLQVIRNRLSSDLPKNHQAAEEIGITIDQVGEYLHSRDISRMLERVAESAERAAKIVQNMLNFSRMEGDTLQSTDIRELVDKTVELARNDYSLKKQYDFRHVDLQLHYDDDLPMVPCEPSSLQQVILNLLKNAAHAIAENEDPEAAATINVRVSTEQDNLKIEVEDSGPGVSAEVQKHIFDPFFTTKPAGEGTGLGLSISYFIITEHHRGRMELETGESGGARFVIRIPLMASEAEDSLAS